MAKSDLSLKFILFFFSICIVNSENHEKTENKTLEGSTTSSNLNVINIPANNTHEKLCKNDYLDLDGKPINITEKCKNKHCIAKCCKQLDRIFFYNPGETVKCKTIKEVEKLTSSSINIDYSKINIYKSDIEEEVVKTGKDFLTHFTVILNKRLSKRDCSEGITDELKKFYLLENDSLVFEHPNHYARFPYGRGMGEFCIEHFVKVTKGGVQGPLLIYKEALLPPTIDTNEDHDHLDNVLKITGMLLSCFFLLLVIFVYAVISELRNLVGMVLMAYVGTLVVTFFIKCLEQLGASGFDSSVCKPMSLFLYYMILSSIFWMNVMSFDIWWTFRGMFKSRPIHRRGELAKFGWYALYSWGVPLLITIPVGIIDYADLSHAPHVFKPHFEDCFVIKGNQIELKYYLYVPIMIVLVADWIFFLMTAFNIWRIRRSMAQFTNESKYNNNQNRFGLYLKLSLVMGVSWVFEVVDLPPWPQTVALAYNSLIGVAIFLIFVCKRKVLYMLCQRFSVKGRLAENLQRKFSSASGALTSSDRKRSAVETSSITA